MANNQKRPVYLVVRKLGFKDRDGNEAKTVLEIKQTHLGAEIAKAKYEGAEIEKGFVTQ